jgi:hypothetical protein
MTLSCDRKPYSNGTVPGIAVSKVTIVDAVDISGTTLPYLQRPVDLGITLKLDIGRSFQPEMTIAGNFKTDPSTGECTSSKGFAPLSG